MKKNTLNIFNMLLDSDSGMIKRHLTKIKIIRITRGVKRSRWRPVAFPKKRPLRAIK